MPGIKWAGVRGGAVPVPFIEPLLLANSLNGTGTPPAAAIQEGDLVVLTTKSTLNGTTSNPVVRMLLAADKTANYQQGTPVAGIYGVAIAGASADSNGVPTAGTVANNAQPIFSLPSIAAGQPLDTATGRGQLSVATFVTGQVFAARLSTAGGSVTLTHQYDNTLAGFILSTTNGVTTYTIDVNATSADQCIRLIEPDITDPLFNTLVAQNAPGPWMFFEALGTFSQHDTGVSYSSN